MLSVSFTCLKSRHNKAGQSPIQLWVNVDGKRATTILNLRATPSEFKKAMKSKQNKQCVVFYVEFLKFRKNNTENQSVKN